MLAGDMLFGYDTGSFSGILANPVSFPSSAQPVDRSRELIKRIIGLREAIWSLQRIDGKVRH